MKAHIHLAREVTPKLNPSDKKKAASAKGGYLA